VSAGVMRAASCALLAAAWLLVTPAGAATFTLVPGNGFADPTVVAPEGGNTGTTLGQQRTILFTAAAQAWATALSSGQTIKVAAAFNDLACEASSGVLGSAGATNFFSLSAGDTSRLVPVALAEALLNQNINGVSDEISANFNARIDANDPNCLGNTRWYYGLTGPAPAGTIALYPVVLHELAHGLGFAALLCTNPAGCGDTAYGAFFSGIPDLWADFLRDNNVDGAGTNARWIDMSNAQRIVSFTHDPLLVWDGISVTANLGTFGQGAGSLNESRMRMFAPDPFVGGSSLSHFHSVASPNLLMEPSLSAGVFTQTDLTDCLFADIGWINSRCSTLINGEPTLNAIANPATIPVNSGAQVVNLAGIGDGDASVVQALRITATSGNTGLIPNPSVTYTSPNSIGSLGYTPVAGQSGSALITVTVIDDGGTSFVNGGDDRRERSFTVNVSGGGNTPPQATNLSAAENYTEDTTLNLVNIVITDGDSANVTATLTLSNTAAGSLSTATSGAVTSTFVPGTGVWTASGALANVNTLLAGVTFNPAANFNANFNIATSVSDGVAAPITGSKTMTGTAVNDAPQATNLSAAESYTEDTPLNLVNIVVTDVDSASVSATLTLSNTAAGSLSTATSGGVTSTFVPGTGVWTASGALANVNTLLAGVTFNPAANFNAGFNIVTSVSDGVAAPITGSKSMTGAAVNDAPQATNLSAAESYTEDTALNLVNIVVSDVDSANVTATLTLSNTAAGSLSTATAGGVTSTFVPGTGVWTASGALANVNTLLAGVTFNPAANFNASFNIATSVSDGIAAPITGSKAMTGTAVNDAPQATNLSAAESYTEDAPLNLVNIVVSDVDSANVTATLTLSNTAAGSLSTATSGGVTSTFVPGTGVWTASGALANVNTLLAGVSFNPTANFNANFSIATSVSDGVAAPITGSKAMTGTAVNDAPTLNAIANPPILPPDAGLQTVNLSGIGPGPGDPAQTLTVTAVSNNVGLIPNPNVTYTSPAASGSISFTPVAGQMGSALITVTVTDNGGTANGGVNQFSRSFTQQVSGGNLIFANGFE
jgi:predicted cupin superfamily sugar epimerase